MSRDGQSSSEFVVVGHATIDEIIGPGSSGGSRTELGGGVCYSSFCLASLGHKPNIVTRVGSDFPEEYSNLLRIKAGVEIGDWISQSSKTTRFRIYLDNNDRKFTLMERCEDLTMEDLVTCYRRIPASDGIVIVNAVNGELSSATVRFLTAQSSNIFLDSQSFTRVIDPNDGKVTLTHGLDVSFLAGVKVLKADMQELTALTGLDTSSAIDILSKYVKGILVTSGGGETKYYEDGILKCSARPFAVKVKDTIGSGDIILASFTSRLLETGDPVDALEFATAASSLSTETVGVGKAILSRQEIMQRMDHVRVLQN